MELKKIFKENLNHYKDFVLLLFAPNCNWKCCKEQNTAISECANYTYHNLPTIKYSDREILDTFVSSPLHSAVCIAGAEPLDSDDLNKFISFFRANNPSPIIVYTGYTIEEEKTISFIKWVTNNNVDNVILKVGRYIIGGEPHIDPLLGVQLLGYNQYAVKIS